MVTSVVCFFRSVLLLVVGAVEAAGKRVTGEGVKGPAAVGFEAVNDDDDNDVVVEVVVVAAVVDAACPFVVDQVRALGRADMSGPLQLSVDERARS